MPSTSDCVTRRWHRVESDQRCAPSPGSTLSLKHAAAVSSCQCTPRGNGRPCLAHYDKHGAGGSRRRAHDSATGRRKDRLRKVAVAKTMKAAVVRAFGKPLTSEEVTIPTPAAGQVL